MRIIIIGAGLGGCASYLFLRKYLPQHTITLYESHPNPLTISTILGGGLGLAPNGLRTLSLLGEELPRQITQLGFEAPYAEMRSGSGETLLGLFAMGSRKRYGWPNLMVQRAAIHESMLEEVLRVDGDKGALHFGKKVVSLEAVGFDGTTKITFEDGEVVEADLVIGADGLRSKVRDYVMGEHIEPEYYGLCGIGGFVPLSFIEPYIQHTQSQLMMTWGPLGFFGFSPTGSGPQGKDTERKAMWWSIYLSEEPAGRDTPRGLVKEQLQERFKGFEGAIPRILNSLCTGERGVGEILILPRYKLPKFLERWHRLDGAAVLVGDAAHVAPPESGQGVSFAVEDSASFVLLLKHYLEKPGVDEKEAVRLASDDYSKIRKPRVEKAITAGMKRITNKRPMGPWQRWIRDWIIWFLVRVTPESVGDELFGYRVEDAVEGYLREKERRG